VAWQAIQGFAQQDMKGNNRQVKRAMARLSANTETAAMEEMQYG
jgi:hypothetical protein